MNHNYYAQYDNVRIRPLKCEDIEALRIWRNKKDETRYLRDIGHVSSEMQRKWFDEYQLDDTQIVLKHEYYDFRLFSLVCSLTDLFFF